VVEKISVRSWPTYLLRDIPETTRAAIEVDAELDGVSMIEVIRRVLCAHYELECEPVGGRPGKREDGTGTMLLRLQPEVWEALKAEAGLADTAYGSPRGAMDKIIHSALAAHYNGGHPHD
jgi:hypothetical protein